MERRHSLLVTVAHQHDAREGLGLAGERPGGMRAATAIVQGLRREGRVHRSWTNAEAAALVWELVSFRVWDDLVNEAGMTPERYAEIVTTSALATLAAPVRRARR